MEEIYSKILNEYHNNPDINDNESVIFDKEKYTKFYDLLNNVILFFIINSFETFAKNINLNNTNNFDIDKINYLISNTDSIINSLRMQMNICWMEYRKPNNNYKDQLITDFDDLLSMDIITHKICLFNFIKNNCISIIKELCKIKFENIKNIDEYVEKIANITNALLQINKVTGLDDEDDFNCIDCNYTSDLPEIFWLN